MGEAPSAPRNYPNHGVTESKNTFEQVGATTFCVFPLIVAPPKITSYIEVEMGGRRHGEELPPKITDCIEDEMGGRRGGKWGEGDGYLLLQRLR